MKCPQCEMELVKRGGVEGASQPARHPGLYRCPIHTDHTLDRPGFCAICGAALVKREGPEPEKKGQDGKKPEERERIIYVCDLHPEEVFDKPGVCAKGG